MIINLCWQVLWAGMHASSWCTRPGLFLKEWMLMSLIPSINQKLMLWMIKNVQAVTMMTIIILIKIRYLKLFHKLNIQETIMKIKFKFLKILLNKRSLKALNHSRIKQFKVRLKNLKKLRNRSNKLNKRKLIYGKKQKI